MDHQSVFKSTLPMCEQGHIQCMWYQLKDAQSRRLGILVKDTLIHEILSTQVGGGGWGKGHVASCYRIWDKLCLV